MDNLFDLPSEYKELRSSVRALAEKEIAPFAQAVDEEHRFGVRQKDALKALRAEVDILTLTATPIPRTLGMAMEGLREFSVIATAPQKRLAIKTFVRREGDGVVREAVLREIKRSTKPPIVSMPRDSGMTSSSSKSPALTSCGSCL